MADVNLINPPQFIPDIPLVAFPILKATLKESGLESRFFDLNVDYYHYVLSEENIRSYGHVPEHFESLDEFVKSVSQASRDLRQILPFDNLNRYLEARETLEDALNFLVEPYGARLGFMNSSLAYRHDASASVLQAIKDRQKNPYIPFYESKLEGILESEIVGIGVLVPEQIIPAFTLAKMVKDKSPDTTIILGGNTFSRIKDGIEASPLSELYDFGITSEADDALPKLVFDLLAGNKVKSLQSYEESTPDVKALPSPDWSDVDFSKYFSPEPVAPLLGGRGCYFLKCTFCAIPRMWKESGNFRPKAPERVFEEAKELYEIHGVQYFKFVEESHSLGFARTLSDLVQKSELPLRFEAFTNLEPGFGREAEHLFKGGYRRFLYGLETVSPSVEQAMQKRNCKIASQRDTIIYQTDQAGIVAFTFLIVGAPQDTKEGAIATAEYVIGNPRIKNEVVSVYSLDKFAPDSNPSSVLQKGGLVTDVEQAGDLSCHYKYRLQGKEVTDQNRQLAKDVLQMIHSERPDLAFMASFLPAARLVYIGAYGHDFAQQFTEKHGNPQLDIANKVYAQARIMRKP